MFVDASGKTAITNIKFFCDVSFGDSCEDHIVYSVDINIFEWSAEFDAICHGLTFPLGTSVSNKIAFVFAQRGYDMEEQSAICRCGINIIRD